MTTSRWIREEWDRRRGTPNKVGESSFEGKYNRTLAPSTASIRAEKSWPCIQRWVKLTLSSTQASVLTVTSNPTRTSPVKRGRWVLEQLLGAPPPPPPPNVPELSEKEKDVAATSLRQRMEVHRRNPACANCHA